LAVGRGHFVGSCQNGIHPPGESITSRRSQSRLACTVTQIIPSSTANPTQVALVVGVIKELGAILCAQGFPPPAATVFPHERHHFLRFKVKSTKERDPEHDDAATDQQGQQRVEDVICGQLAGLHTQAHRLGATNAGNLHLVGQRANTGCITWKIMPPCNKTMALISSTYSKRL
jgi:hypothetical protein